MDETRLRLHRVPEPTVPTRVLLTETSWWPCASRVGIGLEKMGCAVSAIYPSSGHPLSKTRVLQQRFRYSPLDPMGSLKKAIEAVNPDIIVPCDDRAVTHLHELYARELKEYPAGGTVRALIEKSLGPPESYPIVASRDDLLKIAQEEGIRIPGTKLITDVSQLKADDIGLEAPWVLKADSSWGGHGVRIASHPRQAKEFYLELTKPLSAMRFIKRLIVDRDPYWLQTWLHKTKPAVIVQSYVQGHPANSAVLCWNGKVLAGIAAEVVNAQGATGSATVVRIVDRPDLLLPAERLAQRFGLSGFFGFDFMIEEKTGEPYLIEMNPRCTPLSHLQLGSGRDLIAALSAQLMNTAPREQPPVTKCETIAYFPQAWHWDPESPLLKSSFRDVPWDEPDLVHDLLRLPWPDRSPLARMSNLLRRTTFRDRTLRGGAFDSVLENSAEPHSEGLPSDGGRGNPVELSAVVELRGEGSKSPLFLIHGVDGTLERFHSLVRHLEPDQPIYGLLAQSLLGEPIALMSVEELAAYYIQALQAVRPHGPYNFLGFSFGGLVAFEMARQLVDRGEQVEMLGMLDNLRMGPPPVAEGPLARLRRFASDHFHVLLSRRALVHMKDEVLARFLRTIYTLLHSRRRPIPRILQRAININWFAARHYVPQLYPGIVTLFQARESENDPDLPTDMWARVAGGGVELYSVPGRHEVVLAEPNVGELAKVLTDCLAKHQRVSQPPSSALSSGGILGHYLRDSSVASPEL